MSTIRVVNLQHTDATEPNIVLESDGTAVFASGITISGGTNLTISGIAEFASGTVSAPTITFIDDNNTGIYEPAADTVAITTAATERLRVDNSGNVGIGTTSPGAKLDVQGVVNFRRSGTVFSQIDGNSAVDLVYTANASQANVSPSHIFKSSTAGGAIVERMRIDSSGNVGVGTSNPSTKLHIEGTDNNFITLGHATRTGSWRIEHSGANSENLAFIQDNGTSAANSYFAGRDLHVFYTSDTERMRIDSSGRLLLGTASAHAGGVNIAKGFNGSGFPAAGASTASLLVGNDDGGYGLALGANGSGVGYIQAQRGDGLLAVYDIAMQPNGGNVGIGSVTPALKLHVEDSGQQIIRFARTGIGAGSLDVDNDGNAVLNSHTTSKSLVFHTQTIERMRIDSSGRLLVGVSSNNTDTDLVEFNAAAANSSQDVLIISGGTAGFSGTNDANTAQGIRFKACAFNTSAGIQELDAARIKFEKTNSWNTGGTAGSVSGKLIFEVASGTSGSTTLTERMRISQNGDTGIFGSSTTLAVASSAAAGTSLNFIVGNYSATSTTSGTASFIVRTNGNVLNTNDSYGAISDIKLKENIVDAGSQWDDFKAVRFRKYNFKEETGHETFTQLGVIAQELEQVCPGLVDESPDLDEEGNDLGTTTKSVKYSILTKKALVALQEAMERIETLEAKVAALEAK